MINRCVTEANGNDAFDVVLDAVQAALSAAYIQKLMQRGSLQVCSFLVKEPNGADRMLHCSDRLRWLDKFTVVSRI